MRRARPPRDRLRPSAAPAPAFHRPFSSLGRTVRPRVAAAEPAHTPPLPAAAPPPPVDDATAFARAMTGVVPLPAARRQRVDGPQPAAMPREPVGDDAEALAELSDLVTGEVTFDVTDTREYVEGSVTGLDPRLVRQLRRGEFPWQAHLDLHGLTAAAARPVVERFLVEALRAGRRCVRIVHGRGHNSKDQTPVLKTKLMAWLSRGVLGRMVLAFTSARPHDGGSGALYVLLRRDRRRHAFRVGAGTGT